MEGSLSQLQADSQTTWVANLTQSLLLCHYAKEEASLSRHLVTIRTHLGEEGYKSTLQPVAVEMLEHENFRKALLYFLDVYQARATDLQEEIIAEIVWIIINLVAVTEVSNISVHFELDTLKKTYLLLYYPFNKKLLTDILLLWANIAQNPLLHPYFLEYVLSKNLLNAILNLRTGPAINSFMILCFSLISKQSSVKKKKLAKRLLDIVIKLVHENLQEEETLQYALRFINCIFDDEYPSDEAFKLLDLFGLFNKVNSTTCTRILFTIVGALASHESNFTLEYIEPVMDIMRKTIKSQSIEKEIPFALSNLLSENEATSKIIFDFEGGFFKTSIRNWLDHTEMTVVSEALYCLEHAFQNVKPNERDFFYGKVKDLSSFHKDSGIKARANKLLDMYYVKL